MDKLRIKLLDITINGLLENPTAKNRTKAYPYISELANYLWGEYKEGNELPVLRELTSNCMSRHLTERLKDELKKNKKE